MRPRKVLEDGLHLDVLLCLEVLHLVQDHLVELLENLLALIDRGLVLAVAVLGPSRPRVRALQRTF